VSEDEQQTPEGIRIELRQNGPVMISGPFTLDDGTSVSSGERLALCRCGASATKPRCDGAHKACDFEADGVAPAAR
jgi:CDGSH-type Zn-finger protein